MPDPVLDVAYTTPELDAAFDLGITDAFNGNVQRMYALHQTFPPESDLLVAYDMGIATTVERLSAEGLPS